MKDDVAVLAIVQHAIDFAAFILTDQPWIEALLAARQQGVAACVLRDRTPSRQFRSAARQFYVVEVFRPKRRCRSHEACYLSISFVILG